MDPKERAAPTKPPPRWETEWADLDDDRCLGRLLSQGWEPYAVTHVVPGGDRVHLRRRVPPQNP